MKKLTVFLTVLIILSGISTCSFASGEEATGSELAAYSAASEFLDDYVTSVSHITDDDLSEHTLAYYDDAPQIYNEILAIAKENEDEIRDNHYRLYEDSKTIAEQYDNMSIEDILTSFPVFFQKKLSYMRVVSSYDAFNTDFSLSPVSVTAGESGFAYVNYGECRVLLYKCTLTEVNHRWFVFDIINLHDEYDEKYRFNSEDLDVDKELISNGYTPATDEELSAYDYAATFLGRCEFLDQFKVKEFSFSKYTMTHLDDSQKREIIKKAKEYEDEIRDYHHYRFYEDSKDSKSDENAALPPAIFDKRPVCNKYDNAAIEDIITSFPIYLEKKLSDLIADKDLQGPHYSLYKHAPLKVTVSESGFAYVNYGSLYVLLYKYGDPADDEWVVCDVSTFYDRYDEEHRFSPEALSVRKEQKSQGYTPWVICGIEAAAIIALAIALIIKIRRKNKRADENENTPEEQNNNTNQLN